MAIEYIGVSQAAAIIGVSPGRVRALVRTNRIKAEGIEGRYLIHREEVNRFKSIPRLPGKPKKSFNT